MQRVPQLPTIVVVSTWKRALVVVVCIGAALCAGHTRLNSQRHFASTQRYEDIYYLPPPDWLVVFSLGYREALSGLIWLRTLVYFGDELVHRGSAQYTLTYADAILELDPYFARAYRWIAISNAYRPGEVDTKSVRSGIRYLERAARLMPDDGQIAWDLASFYLFELKPYLKDPKEIEEAQRKGAEHMRTAAMLGAGPPWLALNAAAEMEKMGQREQQIAFLQEAYGQVSTDEVREQIQRQLAVLQNQSFAEAFAREQDQAEASRKRDFPYLDFDLFLQVGQKPAFDHLPLLKHGFDPTAAQSAVELDDEP